MNIEGVFASLEACELLKVSTSAYYEWAKREPKDTTDKDASLVEEIKRITLEFPGYGYRQVRALAFKARLSGKP